MMRHPFALRSLLLVLWLATFFVLWRALFPAVDHGDFRMASVSLEWSYTYNPEQPAVGFVVERCEGDNCTHFTVITPTPLPLTSQTFTDATVRPYTAYRWQIRAIDAEGRMSAPSNLAKAEGPHGKIRW